MTITGCGELDKGNLGKAKYQKAVKKTQENYISNFGEKQLRKYGTSDISIPVLGDMDGDGDLDMVIAKYDHLVIIENKIPQKPKN